MKICMRDNKGREGKLEYTEKEIRKYTKHYNRLEKLLDYGQPEEEFLQALEKALKDGFPVDFVPKTMKRGKHPKKRLLTSSIVYANHKNQNIPALALINAGADVNIKDGSGWNSLMFGAYAVSIGENLFETLVEKTIDINEVSDGTTVLGNLCYHCLYYKNDPEMEKDALLKIRILLERGADPDLDTRWKECSPKMFNSQEDFEKRLERISFIEDFIQNFYDQKEAQKYTDNIDVESYER